MKRKSQAIIIASQGMNTSDPMEFADKDLV